MKDELRNKLHNLLDEILKGPMSLDRAILIAVLAHAKQKDMGRNSYIRHPLRVMEQMDSEYEMCVAVVHDVIEDSDFTLEDLAELGYTQDQLDATDALTKREGEEYMDGIRNRVSKSIVATKVKEKDIKDNSQLWRLKNRILQQKDLNRMQNYISALEFLGSLNRR